MSNQAPTNTAVKQQSAQERRLMGLSAFDRHQWLMKDAIKYYRAKLPPEQQTIKTDYDVLKEQYRFVAHANHAHILATACGHHVPMQLHPGSKAVNL